MYKPLPDCLTIKESPIHGLGLYATEDIPEGTKLGNTHWWGGKEDPHRQRIIRTPLGGFYNHSDSPNCVKKEHRWSEFNVMYYLVTLRDIKAGEEITVKYTMYDPTTR
jgi:SET domain-containing protein